MPALGMFSHNMELMIILKLLPICDYVPSSTELVMASLPNP